MRRRVKTLTEVFIKESGGDEKMAAQILSNFHTQRAVAPFVFREIKTPVENFGSNVAQTIRDIKSTSDGSLPGALNRMRHCLIASGATGPLSNNQISKRELARICGYGNNPRRVAPLADI